jgi:CRP-like cAMP-binding protein
MMLEVVKEVGHTNTAPVTAGLTASKLASLTRVAKPVYVSLPVNSVIDRETFQQTPVLVTLNGTIGLQHILKDGRRSISTLYLGGEIIDLRRVSNHRCTLKCFSNVDLMAFDAKKFDTFRDQNPSLQKALTDNFFRHCGFTANHCADLARKSAVEKLASFIFECRKRQSDEKSPDVFLILKRIDIADYMGLRPETLCRAFAKLKQRKLIKVGDMDHITILDESKLRLIANGGS